MNVTSPITSSTPQNALPPFDVYTMIGPVVLSALVNACLFGGLVIQTYVYYANFPNDHRAMKLTVAAVLASQIAHVICVSATLWKVAVSGYGNPLTLLIFPLGADAVILFTAITGILVELFFAFRLWKLSKTFTVPLISLVLCLLAQCIALAMTAKGFAMTNLLTFEIDGNRLITLAFTSRLVCELSLTLSMVWYLRKQRSMTFSRTTTMIDRLVLWTLETGLLASLVAVFTMSFFLAMKQNYIWVGMYAILATVNANSLLASLNGRLILRSVPNDSLNMGPLSSSSGGRSRKAQSVVINVTQTVGSAPGVFKYDGGEV